MKMSHYDFHLAVVKELVQRFQETAHVILPELPAPVASAPRESDARGWKHDYHPILFVKHSSSNYRQSANQKLCHIAERANWPFAATDQRTASTSTIMKQWSGGTFN